MLAAKIIRPSLSPYAAPVLIVKKKDGSLRFVTDFRRLNAVTSLSGFPLPRIDDILDSLGENNKVWSQLDMKSGFFGVKIREQDIHKTGFVTPDGHYEYVKMGQGMKQSPLTYQMMMSAVLSGLVLTGTVAAYIDDIIIGSPTVDEHLLSLRTVLERFRQAKLTLHPGKCRFLQTHIEVFGFILDKDGVRPAPSKVAALRNMSTPTNVTGVRSFLGLAGFYRKFIPRYSQVAKPLTNLTKNDPVTGRPKNVAAVWGDDEQSAFDSLKSALLHPPILAHFDPRRPVIIKTDASNDAIGGVICQRDQQGRQHPILFTSRLLSDAERNYPITEKEALACIWILDKHRPYTFGTAVTIETDHQCLQWLRKIPHPTPRQARWVLNLAEYEASWNWKPGKTHVEADFFSRHAAAAAPTAADEDAVNVQTYAVAAATTTTAALTPVNWRREQLKEEEFATLIEYLEADEPRQRQASSLLQRRAKQFVMNHGILHKRNFQSFGNPLLLVVPLSQVEMILQHFHDDPFPGGHLLTEKMQHKIASRFHFSKLQQRVADYCKSCVICQRRKNRKVEKYGLLKPIAPGEIRSTLCIDLSGKLPTSAQGNKYILVCAEYVSRWAFTRAIPDARMSTIITVLTELFLTVGPCRRLLSDKAAVFAADVYHACMQRMGITPVLSAPYTPQQQGLVEKFNSTLAGMISAYVSDHQRDWEKYLPEYTLSYNCSRQASTKFAPYEIFFGSAPKLPADIMFFPENEPEAPLQHLQYVADTRARAVANLERAQQRQAQQYNKGRIEKIFKPGEKVLVEMSSMRKRGMKKTWISKFQGPYEIVASRGQKSYLCRLLRPEGSRLPRTPLVHVHRMRPFFERQLTDSIDAQQRSAAQQE